MSKIIILGASGFIGRNLSNSLNEEHTCFVRNIKKVNFNENVHVVQGDLNDIESLSIIKEYDVIFYLVHSMSDTEDYAKIEAQHAQNLSSLLTKKQKVIYLSGLAQGKSEHMSSRHKVEDILRESAAQTITLQASIILGEGSLSFELIRAIVERFPFIINTTWSTSLCEPLALDDLLRYLKKAITYKAETKDSTFEIGSGVTLEYQEMLSLYAKINKLKRPVITVKSFPKELVHQVMDIYLSEYSNIGKALLSSIEVQSIVINKSDFQEKHHVSPQEAMRSNSTPGIKKYNMLSFEDIKRFQAELGPMELKEEYTFPLLASKDLFFKLLSRALDLYSLNPFKKFNFVEPQLNEDEFSFKIIVQKVELDANFKVIEGKVIFTYQYQSQGLIDSGVVIAISNVLSFIESTIQKLPL